MFENLHINSSHNMSFSYYVTISIKIYIILFLHRCSALYKTLFLRFINQSSVYKVTRTQYLRVVTFRYRLFVDYIHRQVLSSIQFVIKWNANVAPKSYLNCFAHLTLAQSRKCKLIFNQKKLIMFNNDK